MSRQTRMAFIEILSMALLNLFVASAQAQDKLRPLVFTVGPEEVVASRSELTRAVPTNHSWPDSPLGVIKVDEGHYWFMASGGDGSGSPGLVRGTLDHLVSGNLVYPVSPVLDFKTKRPIVPERYTYAGSGPFYVEPRSGSFIQFVHLEITFGNAQQNNPFYSRLGLAISKNRGKTWHFVCEIIGTVVSLPDWKAYVQKNSSSPWLDTGPGSYAIVDDKGASYFYVYFGDNSYPVGAEGHLGVARAKVAEVVSRKVQLSGKRPCANRYPLRRQVQQLSKTIHLGEWIDDRSARIFGANDLQGWHPLGAPESSCRIFDA